MRVNNVLFNKAKRSGFLTKVEVISQQVAEVHNYQIKVEDIISRIADGEDVMFFQKSQTLYHWLEDHTSYKSDVWAKLPKLPVTKPQIVNVLSGNPSDSDGRSTMELVDEFPTVQDWYTGQGSPVPEAKGDFACIKIGTKVYIICGDTAAGVKSARNDEYDIDTDTWVNKTDCPQALDDCSGSDADGHAYMIGGEGGAGSIRTVREFNIAGNSWAVKTDMPLPAREEGLVVSVNNKIYLFGGYDSTGPSFPKDCDEYDPDSWTSKTDSAQSHGRASKQITVHNNIIYFGGGYTGIVYHQKFYCYDPVADSYTELADIPTAIPSEGALIAHGEYLYYFGSYVGGGVFKDYTYRYDIVNNTWQKGRSALKEPMAYFGAVVHGNTLFTFGGRITGNIDIDTVYKYDLTKWVPENWEDVGGASHTIADGKMSIDIGAGYSMVVSNESFNIGKAFHFTLVSRTTVYASAHLPHETGSGGTERDGYMFFVKDGGYIKIYKYEADGATWQEDGTVLTCPQPSNWELRWWQDGADAELRYLVDNEVRVSRKDTLNPYTSGYIGWWDNNNRDQVVSAVYVRNYVPDVIVIKRKISGKAGIIKSVCGGIVG